MGTSRIICTIYLLLANYIGSSQVTNHQKAENFYARYLAIYQNIYSGTSEVKNAIPYLDSAIRIEPRSYKYAYALGAAYKYIKDYSNAKTWYQNSFGLTDDTEEKKNVELLINYCNMRVTESLVASRTASGPGIDIWFILKHGNNELSDETVTNFDKVLPESSLNEGSTAITDVLKNKIEVQSLCVKNEFLVVSLSNQRTAEEHYYKGIDQFDNFFKRTFSFREPIRFLTILLTENPKALVDATNRLYPRSHLQTYAPFLGYFNKNDNLIAANGGTYGYGTLLHELIHAYLNVSFPDAPKWFNEGLATLYERTEWKGNNLKCLPNWRFDNLKPDDFDNLNELIGNINHKNYNLDNIRMLLLYFDHSGKIGELYNYIQANKDSIDLTKCLRQFHIDPIKWEEFIAITIQEYKTELYASMGSLTNPDEIKYAQLALNKILNKQLKVDGFWGTGSQDALIEFQKKYGMNPDGIFGSQTLKMLGKQFDKMTIK